MTEFFKPSWTSVLRREAGRVVPMYGFLPEEEVTTGAAILFFPGGGWNQAPADAFFPQSRYLSLRGMAAFSSSYRTAQFFQATPFDGFEDASLALQKVREHAHVIGFEPSRVLAGGGSAGGHLAVCTALFAKSKEDRPAGLVLFNPALDVTTPESRRAKFVGRAEELSPLHHVRKGVPSTLIMTGEADEVTLPETARVFTARARAKGNDVELKLFPEAGHGFFHLQSSLKHFRETVQAMDAFLVARGFLRPLDKAARDILLTQVVEETEDWHLAKVHGQPG